MQNFIADRMGALSTSENHSRSPPRKNYIFHSKCSWEYGIWDHLMKSFGYSNQYWRLLIYFLNIVLSTKKNAAFSVLDGHDNPTIVTCHAFPLWFFSERIYTSKSHISENLTNCQRLSTSERCALSVSRRTMEWNAQRATLADKRCSKKQFKVIDIGLNNIASWKSCGFLRLIYEPLKTV